MADSRLPRRTPAKATPPSTNKQRSIHSYFVKPPNSSSPAAPTPLKTIVNAGGNNSGSGPRPSFVKMENAKENRHPSTPMASSDPLQPSSPIPDEGIVSGAVTKSAVKQSYPIHSSPTRKGKKKVNYAESDGEDDDVDVFSRLSRRRQPRAVPIGDDDVDFEIEDDLSPDTALDEDDEMVDFIASEDEEHERKLKKRKRGSKPPPPRKKKAPSPPTLDAASDGVGREDEAAPESAPTVSSRLKRWARDASPPAPGSSPPPPVSAPRRPAKPSTSRKEKVCFKEPEERYSWLADIRDSDGNRPGHPDYNPSKIFIPSELFDERKKNSFTAFERQYWAIKRDLWDTVVFFKKGKFYELYEADATIGHQVFDLKLTDRVNMRMVGVPEGTIDTWKTQFVAKGYKVAIVDQMESALAKVMRERDDAGPKKVGDAKIIHRELSCILTAGTLVDGRMLQDDQATYCASIKQCAHDGKPAFGIAFVDTATGEFFLSQFVDDADLTRFETFLAQIMPRELIVEKGSLSTRALRVLKTNTTPATLWNYRKAGDEFWDADTTRRDIDARAWFGDGAAWPAALEEARDKDLLVSALGGLVQYLRVLKLDQGLLSQGHFEWYDPIKRNGTLVLDGQTLINLEVFVNSTGGTEGTLFGLLNRCETPFGKRLFRNWVCHPSCDVARIRERLDAVDVFNSDVSSREQFGSVLRRMPDLERLMSRIHAGACRGDDFLRVIEGFEQFADAMSALDECAGRSALLDGLVRSMPDLQPPLEYWANAFDRKAARDERVLRPLRGIDPDYDESLDRVGAVKSQLDALLAEKKADLRNQALKFVNIGKEIHQVEAPTRLKVPSDWRQMSATSSVRRYYFPALIQLVRNLQEADEMHSQVIREAAFRFCRRFNDGADQYWLRAVRILSRLDGLLGLARASHSLGEPSCRPDFVDRDRTVIEFDQLRHPCMMDSVSSFIPNDVQLGGNRANINLLTGANAAGKSTVLRMTCTAVILAQIGCYVPAMYARLTPVDRIMSRLGANDNIFAAQSTFLVELSETRKILAEASPRSLVILDELGRGTSSYDGVAVAQAVLHNIATHIGCVGFFATHYHSLAAEFENHPEIRPVRMGISVDGTARRVDFLYRLEDGVAAGSYGMHCASMCGIPDRIVERAEEAARKFEHTSRLKQSLDHARRGCYIPLGMLSDVSAVLNGGPGEQLSAAAMDVLLRAVEKL